MELISNPYVVAALKRSEEDIKKGRVRKVDSVKDLL